MLLESDKAATGEKRLEQQRGVIIATYSPYTENQRVGKGRRNVTSCHGRAARYKRAVVYSRMTGDIRV